MAVLDKPAATPKAVNPKVESLFISDEKMDELRAIVAWQFEELGIDYDPHVTAEQVRGMMLADGIRPEDNEFSRGIIAMREE